MHFLWLDTEALTVHKSVLCQVLVWSILGAGVCITMETNVALLTMCL